MILKRIIKNTKIFSITKKIIKLYCVIAVSKEKLKNLKKPRKNLLEKTLVLPIICSKCKNEDEKLFKEEESIETLKFFSFRENI